MTEFPVLEGCLLRVIWFPYSYEKVWRVLGASFYLVLAALFTVCGANRPGPTHPRVVRDAFHKNPKAWCIIIEEPRELVRCSCGACSLTFL